MPDNIAWAIHKDNENKTRFKVGFKNLTKDEATELLLTLDRLQQGRANA